MSFVKKKLRFRSFITRRGCYKTGEGEGKSSCIPRKIGEGAGKDLAIGLLMDAQNVSTPLRGSMKCFTVSLGKRNEFWILFLSIEYKSMIWICARGLEPIPNCVIASILSPTKKIGPDKNKLKKVSFTR